MPAREPFDIENEESAYKRSGASANANLSKQIGGVAVALLCILGLVSYFFLSGSSKNGGPPWGALKVMTLNAGSYQEMCGVGVPDHTVSKTKDDEYKVSGTCPAGRAEGEDHSSFLGDCADDEIAMQCCARNWQCRQGRINRGLEGCADTGKKHFPHYIDAAAGNLKEPLCFQGAREQLENLVLQSKADVIAVQEDLEYTPLKVPGYVTIASPPAYVNGYVPDGAPTMHRQDTVELHDQKGNAIHMVNTLLVRTELLDKEATLDVCENSEQHTHKHTVCGMVISTKEWETLRGQILDGTLKVQSHVLDKVSQSTREVDQHKGDERLFIAAKQVAALAVINWNGQQIALSSAKLSGGAFDDQLMMGDFAAQIEDERLRKAPQMEKVHQVEAIVERLKAKGYGGKMMIMGDFGGPDDFGHWFWNALLGYDTLSGLSQTSRWGVLHPALATTFSKGHLNDETLNKYLSDDESKEGKGNVFDGDLEQLSKDLRPLIQTKQGLEARNSENSGEAKKTVLNTVGKDLKQLVFGGHGKKKHTAGDEGKAEDNEEARKIISELVAFLKPWWTGMHKSLEEKGLQSVYTPQDFEHFTAQSEHEFNNIFENFGITWRGTTKLLKFFTDPNGMDKMHTRGNVADYVYVSKELLQAVSDQPEKLEETDENRELHKNSGLFAKDRAARYEIVSFASKDDKHITEAPEEGFGSAKAWLVPEVLGKIAQHAPVVVCFGGSVKASDGSMNCKPPGPLYPGAKQNPEPVGEPVSEAAVPNLQQDEDATEALATAEAEVAKDITEQHNLETQKVAEQKQLVEDAEKLKKAALVGKSAEAIALKEAIGTETALKETRDNLEKAKKKLATDEATRVAEEKAVAAEKQKQKKAKKEAKKQQAA